MQFVSATELREAMSWERAIDALARGHAGNPPKVQDILISTPPYTLFGRGVVLPGWGAGMKIASIHPPNTTRPVPTPVEHAVFAVIDEESKQFRAFFDGPELTRWKTAADSALGSRLLSRADSETLLVLGAGPISEALVDAHLHARPSLKRVLLWNRTASRLKPVQDRLLSAGHRAEIVSDLREAISQADIISAATGTRTPLITGEDVRPGTHVDLVGGYAPDMREADDDLMTRAKVFVDCRLTAVDHTGDICNPVSRGLLSPADILGDLFDLVAAPIEREGDDITLYKNAGGAHFDLMVAHAFFTSR
ncbi:ornithine cyclodeaminase [Defluviimonas sp. WL0024]|uniref:Ornithine cyclodeaminase n=1 Tax=Albidovulum salinarum TaxID=2984153 RepID=A0ABT2X8T2_9RHOB|nr:ornithine cyclodeaminase [Defluviimonas sp. WL0024]MCU9850352.1 ornithine cyclodeaminase [Defluviimonas sp. WL0024]